MFAKNKVSQSMIDAVNSIVNEAEKVPTPTGMRVYGSSYGNSEKARKDQLKSPVDDVEEPDEKQVTGKDKDLQYKKTPGVSNTYKKHSGRYFSNMDVNKPSKGREEPRYKNEETEVAEELKGNQHKIDANHNNKIDGQDFKILRGKKKVKEDTFSGKLLNSLSESEEIRKAINEVMKKDATAGDWIHDFVHSKNPKFAGKSTKERQKMALGAYYAKQNESVEDLQTAKTSSEAEDTAARKSIKAKATEKSQKIDNFDPKYGKPNEFGEEVELDETAPKKMDDVMRGKQNLEPAKKGVVGTVKSDLKNFGRFLAGKKETNEAINPSNQTIDTLAGRSKKVPKEAKIDNAHSSAKVELKAEEVESLDEDRWLMRYLLSKGINPKFIDRNKKVSHAKSDEFHKWKRDHQTMQGEEVEVPFDKPYKTVKKDIKDKSGAVHTPMSRAKDLARQALKKVKNETLMGVAGATSESKKKC